MNELNKKLENSKKETLDALFQLNATRNEAEKLEKLVDRKVVENESLELQNKELKL